MGIGNPIRLTGNVASKDITITAIEGQTSLLLLVVMTSINLVYIVMVFVLLMGVTLLPLMVQLLYCSLVLLLMMLLSFKSLIHSILLMQFRLIHQSKQLLVT